MELLCRHFSGYKPCGKSPLCERKTCSHFQAIRENILIVHLGALGAVVRSTALLLPLKVKHPHSRLIWITDGPADQLLKNHPLIDQVINLKSNDLWELKGLNFEFAYCIDKAKRAAGVLSELNIKNLRGFKMDPISGAILPATSHAQELWNIGLSDQLKFFENEKPETQLIHEALDLGPYIPQGYDLRLTSEEKISAEMRRKDWASEKKPCWESMWDAAR